MTTFLQAIYHHTFSYTAVHLKNLILLPNYMWSRASTLHDDGLFHAEHHHDTYGAT